MAPRLEPNRSTQHPIQLFSAALVRSTSTFHVQTFRLLRGLFEPTVRLEQSFRKQQFRVQSSAVSLLHSFRLENRQS